MPNAINASLFRIVCRNATKVLKRKDSSGTLSSMPNAINTSLFRIVCRNATKVPKRKDS